MEEDQQEQVQVQVQRDQVELVVVEMVLMVQDLLQVIQEEQEQ